MKALDIRRIFTGLRRLAADRRGVAAVEFAFIAPVLLSLYFVTMEVAQGIDANKKVSRVGSMVADLVTQQHPINRSELEAIMKIGEAILQPYNRSRADIVVTAIQITDENTPRARVAWSRKLKNGSFNADAAPGTIATVPDSLRIRNTFLIRVTSELSYRPVITWSASQQKAVGLLGMFDALPMSETYYLRPRMSQTIPCQDC
ncbi:TadE/TadG family type IV pilus assembly protein [Aquamicrobium sp. LC103]|uniref:TadE/TadG family type IV pilus assembly protein n=1 Tax=Aquamicrobium sp. LC103 TaxID=1120658 RepID=UPI00109D22E2|nr:TadE/TadG family type IV pilus assembly protein [Aquamicrobium sp. LC103]TKT74951.1 pilus assembly protein [Aquamicrobium sp. LC103]